MDQIIMNWIQEMAKYEISLFPRGILPMNFDRSDIDIKMAAWVKANPCPVKNT